MFECSLWYLMLPIDQPDFVFALLYVGTLSAPPTFLRGLLSPVRVHKKTIRIIT